MKRGASSGRETVVVKAVILDDDTKFAALAVSKAVGGAVVRNKVKRRLRSVLFGLLPGLPPGVRILVRALPPAADASFQALNRDVGSATLAALRKAAS